MFCRTWITAGPGASSHTKVRPELSRAVRLITPQSVTRLHTYSFLHKLAGQKESEVKEVDKVMYHDWRLIPKHMEHQFRDFQPLPEPPVRYVPYPPLLRAMLLSQLRKADGGVTPEEPALPLKRDVLLSKDYFRSQEHERKRKETAV